MHAVAIAHEAASVEASSGLASSVADMAASAGYYMCFVSDPFIIYLFAAYCSHSSTFFRNFLYQAAADFCHAGVIELFSAPVHLY